MNKYPIITHMLRTLFNVEDGLSIDVAIHIYERAALTPGNKEALKLELLSAFADTDLSWVDWKRLEPISSASKFGQNRSFNVLSPSMKSDIENLLRESRAWLVSQESPTSQSQKWYALGNFKSFLDRVELEPTEAGIARAIHALRHHIVDLLDWSADYCQDISGFCNRADKIRRQYKADR